MYMYLHVPVVIGTQGREFNHEHCLSHYVFMDIGLVTFFFFLVTALYSIIPSSPLSWKCLHISGLVIKTKSSRACGQYSHKQKMIFPFGNQNSCLPTGDTKKMFIQVIVVSSSSAYEVKNNCC